MDCIRVITRWFETVGCIESLPEYWVLVVGATCTQHLQWVYQSSKCSVWWNELQWLPTVSIKASSVKPRRFRSHINLVQSFVYVCVCACVFCRCACSDKKILECQIYNQHSLHEDFKCVGVWRKWAVWGRGYSSNALPSYFSMQRQCTGSCNHRLTVAYPKTQKTTNCLHGTYNY